MNKININEKAKVEKKNNKETDKLRASKIISHDRSSKGDYIVILVWDSNRAVY